MFEQLLSVGDEAPDFELPSTAGGKVTLHEELTKSTVVLFFYVRAFTPICRAEVCSFRDSKPNFDKLSSKVFGISPDTSPLTKRFAEHYELPFPLLIDSGGRVRKAYRVPKLLGLFPGRSTFVIGQDRKLLKTIHAGLQSNVHVIESLEALRSSVAG